MPFHTTPSRSPRVSMPLHLLYVKSPLGSGVYHQITQTGDHPTPSRFDDKEKRRAALNMLQPQLVRHFDGVALIAKDNSGLFVRPIVLRPCKSATTEFASEQLGLPISWSECRFSIWHRF
jgi:hypothetical protein